MSYFDDELVSYKREDIIQYLNLIGYDESDLMNTKIKNCKSMKLEYLNDLYNILDADKVLLPSSRTLGDRYEILFASINDDFIYPTVHERKQAFNDSFAIISRILSLNVSSEEFDPYTIFERTNEVLIDVISGLTTCENISRLKILADNATPEKLLVLSKDIEDLETRKLYELLAYSKYDDAVLDDSVFDLFDKVDESKLCEKISEHIKLKRTFLSSYALNSDEKKLIYRRPSFKELKRMGDYRQL